MPDTATVADAEGEIIRAEGNVKVPAKQAVGTTSNVSVVAIHPTYVGPMLKVASESQSVDAPSY